MMYNEIINYNLYTRLPCKLLQKAGNANPIIEVITPDKGVVFGEIKEIDKGMFRRATEVDRRTNTVIQELRRLEDDATQYLLTKWLKKIEEV